MNRIIISYYTAIKVIIALCLVITSFSMCKYPKKQPEIENAYKQELAEKLYKIRSEDSLLMVLQQFMESKDDVGKMICYKNLGALQRAEGRIPDAISSHKQGLEIALSLNDTVEIVQALNNMGTNFRNLGANSEASLYHYQALNYAEIWSEAPTSIGVKNRIMSLNGIGEISLSIGYYSDAENIFREILKQDNSEQNLREKAINYANLGTIFKTRQQYDSAYIYFQKALELNVIARSDIGIAFCLIDFGELYEKEGKYDLALNEYIKASEMMDKTADKYNRLLVLVSIARVHLKTENFDEFKHYIQLAETIANQTQSLEHLAAIYKLKYDYNMMQGNYQLALNHFTKHKMLQDSVGGIQKATRYMEIRLGHEQNKNAFHLQQMEAESKLQQRTKENAILRSWVVTILLIIFLAALYYAYWLRTISNKKLKKLETARSDFFTKVTHEFRTPLTVIQGLNKQIIEKKEELTDKEKKIFREAIERQSSNLLNLVTLLLDIAKLKRGSDSPEWRRGDIAAYLRMSAETYRIYANEKEVTLVFYSNIDAFEMDFIPAYIDRIISNLISNAIKHTDKGGKIDFVVSQGQRTDTINIRITDTGEGISNEELELIFDYFYQSPYSKNSDGNGIGLTFTKMMVEKMKGKIMVESQLGEGSTFTVVLPTTNKRLPHIMRLKDEERPTIIMPEEQTVSILNEQQEDASDEDNNQKQPLVLVVEDNRDVALYLKLILIDNYRVITACDGQEGLEEAEKHIPDLIITDLMMPVKDGYQMACEIKLNRLLNHIPVIMITAKTSDEDQIRGLRCGAEGYIRKPFLAEELLLLIENIFSNRRILKEKYMNAIVRSGSEKKLYNDDNMRFLQDINSIIIAELNNPALNASFLADKMAMSVSQLSRKINGITGYSTISYVLQLKLNKAKKLLLSEDISITEVADTCGFYDANYFSRVFKKEFGMAPSIFQKNAKYDLKQK